MKKLLSILILVILSFTVQAQTPKLKSVFISPSFGLYNIDREGFSKEYKSNTGFMPSFTLGLPLTSRSYLYGKFSYFVKNGTSYSRDYSITDGKWELISEYPDGTTKFKLWLINTGYLYNIFLSENYTLGINGGLVFGKSTEEFYVNDVVNGNANASGLFGLFGGLIIERNFANSPFSLTAEIQYNLSRSDIKLFGTYGGLNASIGGRFYFKNRRVQ